MSDTLTLAAKDLEGYLKPKLRFYFTVGWIKEPNLDVLVVYYDQRESLPSNAVPSTWRSCRVRTQPTLPPGVRPPETEADYGYAWMVM